MALCIGCYALWFLFVEIVYLYMFMWYCCCGGQFVCIMCLLVYVNRGFICCD